MAQQALAHITGIIAELLFLDHLDRSEGRGGRQWIAAVGGGRSRRIRPWLSLGDLGSGKHSAHGKSAAEALAHGDDIGLHAEIFRNKERSSAAKARDHFVTDKQSTEPLRGFLHGFQPASRWHDIAGRAL